ncbi:MAG TPA: hypothetical protein VNH53_07910 [Sphingomicrobium sp.]|jgi:periplasmic protein TonB|nr:hypothetical protein [Sphingomicrobium sp.]
MPTYRGQSGKPDKAKAIAAVVLVHAGLAAVLVSGLNVDTVHRAVERLRTINITELVPPPVLQPPPPPTREPSAAKDEAAPANIKSRPTPVVAPEPKIPLPLEQQIATAEVKGPEGLDRTAGAASVPGAGTGAGGQGSGFGGGGTGGSGSGSGSGFTPAQRVSKIPDREYRRIVAMSGMRSGRIGITLLVGTDGSASHCRIARSTGNPSVDQLFCQLAVQHVRFRPARDPQGRPVASDVTWFPDWSPNR